MGCVLSRKAKAQSLLVYLSRVHENRPHADEVKLSGKQSMGHVMRLMFPLEDERRRVKGRLLTLFLA
jgi:hypothetical protein